MMSRVHKYRAWDKKEKRMLEVCGLFWDINGTNVVELDTIDPSTPYYELEHRIEDVELMEFTGRLDKNNVKIYEHDLVKKCNCIAPVVFKDGAFVIENGKNWHWKTKPVGHDINKGIEVVGNIFENPELLEDVDKIIADWKLKKDKEGNYYVIKETYYKKED